MKRLSRILFLLASVAAPATASDLDFVLANKSGERFRAVYLSAVADKDWNGNVLAKEDVLEDGESVRVRFPKSSDAEKWDVTVVSESGQPVTFNAVSLAGVDKITLKNNSGVLAAVVE